MVDSESRSGNSDWDSLSLEETTSLGRTHIGHIPQIIRTSPAPSIGRRIRNILKAASLYFQKIWEVTSLGMPDIHYMFRWEPI
ncbi:hypothetical protein Y032_0073g765 [Ancylostoma ceylanicum]|uniref:Uncharacterized protein n=1 Tax=Ancylostoma ceylanicum TaxID=53326 RepID=A0A016TW89_9BILA|nr:hypothetical protein Y032_0073g765 [Ancylostoma ceylanicum]